VLDILYENREYLKNMRNLILSQNKIVERKWKGKIDRLRKVLWNVFI
jgi:Leucine-rich repeat (LRR) protein